jgi:DNA (cytosine-5)-methyltransferase 1
MSTGTKDWYAKPKTDQDIALPLVRTMHKMHRASTDNYYHTEYKPVGKTNLRRLTPLECFRLQGFSDIDYKNVKNINMSDTQMYMQTGNSITVKVVEEIFKNLFK